MKSLTDSDLVKHLLGSDLLLQRRALPKAITFVESSLVDQRQRGEMLLNAASHHVGKSFRVGVTGPRGSGKSAIVDAIGLLLVARGQRVVVLCVDPSSNVSEGSILADKARMGRLACSERAHIRPSAGSAVYGGVAAQTRASIRLCEAAGYDFVIVETIGVGQNECAVAAMTDMVILLQGPSPMEGLQVIKRGIYEHVDLVVVNEADLDQATALDTQGRIASALRLARYGARHHPGSQLRWTPRVRAVSAVTEYGLSALLADVDSYRQEQARDFVERRKSQDKIWMKECIGPRVMKRFESNLQLQTIFHEKMDMVSAGQIAAPIAAREVM